MNQKFKGLGNVMVSETSVGQPMFCCKSLKNISGGLTRCCFGGRHPKKLADTVENQNSAEVYPVGYLFYKICTKFSTHLLKKYPHEVCYGLLLSKSAKMVSPEVVSH